MLILVAALQLLASLALVAKMAGGSTPAIPEDKLAAARAEHQRRQTARSAPSRVAQRAPRPRPQTRTPEPEPEPEAEPEPEPDEPSRRTARPRPTIAAGTSKTSSDESAGVSEVRSLFDRGQFIAALDEAEAFLEENPDDEYGDYIRRVAVTSACAVGELDAARDHFDQLKERDKATTSKRCARYGVEL